MGIGAVQSQAMFAHAVVTQLYASDSGYSIPGSLLNTSPILQALDTAQSTIVTRVAGVAALRITLADLDDAMTSVSTSTQRMAAGDTSPKSVTALLNSMNQLNDTLDRHASILSPRLRITFDEIVRLTKDGLQGIGVTFDSGGNASLNEARFAQALQNDPLAVADALYGELGLAPGLAAMTDVYYNRPLADFVSDEAIAALNPLSGSGLSMAQIGIIGTSSLSGMNATLGAYALTMPGPVQGALLSLLG